LAKKFDESDFKSFRISVNKSIAFSEETTLEMIDKNYWNKPDELTLYYRMQK
jgi:hypothetical protein